MNGSKCYAPGPDVVPYISEILFRDRLEVRGRDKNGSYAEVKRFFGVGVSFLISLDSFVTRDPTKNDALAHLRDFSEPQKKFLYQAVGQVFVPQRFKA